MSEEVKMVKNEQEPNGEATNRPSSNRPLIELVINIVLPTLILNKAGSYLGDGGAVKALIIALAIPIAYATWDLVKNGHKNLISVIGFVSLLLTGGLGLLKLEGIWFAVKEAGIPLLIGLITLGSAFTKRPLIKLLVYNKAVMKTELIKSALQERNVIAPFEKLLRRATALLSLSFFVSSVVNYVLAIRIFKKIPIHLSEAAKAELLNQQIAEMTWQGYVVLLIPSLLCMGLILWYLSKGIERFTGYSFSEVVKVE